MALTKAQVLVLTNPSVRQRLPARKSDFVYADQLLRDIGEKCPRLVAVWERVFSSLDEPTAKWLSATFPGQTFQAGAPVVQQPLRSSQPRNLVTKAIEVLQSYKKS